MPVDQRRVAGASVDAARRCCWPSATRTPPSSPNTSYAPRATPFESCSTPPQQLKSSATSRRACLS